MLLDIEVKIKNWELEGEEMLKTEHYEHVQVKQNTVHSRYYSKYLCVIVYNTLILLATC